MASFKYVVLFQGSRAAMWAEVGTYVGSSPQDAILNAAEHQRQYSQESDGHYVAVAERFWTELTVATRTLEMFDVKPYSRKEEPASVGEALNDAS